MFTPLPSHRRARVWTVSFAAMVSLYALVIVLAEPMRTLAATSTTTSAVYFTVNLTLSNSCTASRDIATGGITLNGSDQDTAGNYITDPDTITCTVITNNATGYTFGWHVATGTGAAGSRTGTGYMNGYISGAGNKIAPFTPTFVRTPQTFSSIAAGDSRWAARLSSTSTTGSGAGVDWGSGGDDAANQATDRWLNVATGSTVSIAKRTSETTTTGDSEVIAFMARISGSKSQEADTYKVIVTFTATTNP
jgi:hypothetical protein